MTKLAVKPGSRRDALRMVVFAAALVALLAGAATAGLYHRQLRAYYYGARLAASGDYAWAKKLWKLKAIGTPGCRLAYLLSSDVKTKQAAAEALAYCAGMKVLHAFVKQEGINTPAEKALADCMSHGVLRWPPPLKGIDVVEGEFPIWERPIRRFPVRVTLEKDAKVSLRYAVGEYEAEVRRFWNPRSLVNVQYTSVTVTRSEASGKKTVVIKDTLPGEW